jgi:hypothetical protein
MIKLTSSDNTNTIYVINENDIVGLNVYKCAEKDYYSVIVKNIHQWVSVDAETFFKVKNLLENKVK